MDEHDRSSGDDNRSEDERFADLVLRDAERRLLFKTIMKSTTQLTGYKVAKLTGLTRPFVMNRISEWIEAGYVIEANPKLNDEARVANVSIARPVKCGDLGAKLFDRHSCFFS